VTLRLIPTVTYQTQQQGEIKERKKEEDFVARTRLVRLPPIISVPEPPDSEKATDTP
jgi:hypothetical protein